MTINFKKQNINPEALNLWKTQHDYALFLPSISAIYAKIVSTPEYNVRSEMPKGFPNGRKDLDFLDPNTNLFYYPVALYSAGHAYLDINDSIKEESMVQNRNRKNTVILGDSGGFQIATGTLKWPWEKKKDITDEDWRRDKDKIRMKILRWLEHTADYSMVLDVPTYALVRYGLDPITGQSLHPGVKTFGDCLSQSLDNYDFFIKNRKEGATKFLNVLQGRNESEGDIWWDAVKDLPFETWAFSNVQASNFTINLRRLIIMRDGKYLDGRDWLHYLGNGKIKAGCALTTLQRSIRKYINSDITISFDAASPFVMVARGQIYHGYNVQPNDMKFKGGLIVDDKNLKGSNETLNDYIQRIDRKGYIVSTKIGDRCTVGDICIRDFNDITFKKKEWTKKELSSAEYIASLEGQAGDKFKWTQEYKDYLIKNNELFQFNDIDFSKEENKYQGKWPSSMDGFSYLLGMNHSVELHIRACQEACAKQDLPINQAANYIGSDLLEFKDLCDEIFTTEKPMDLIYKNEKILTNITGMQADNHVNLDISEI